MTAAGFQGQVGQHCQGLLSGLKFTASSHLDRASRVRVVLDAQALDVLTTTPSALRAFKALAPNAEAFRFDVDLAICQGKTPATSPKQFSQSKLRQAHNDAATALGGEKIFWPLKIPSLHMDAEHLYAAAYENFWLLNKVHQCINEAAASDDLQLAARIGGSLRKLVCAHNTAHAKYPDEFFTAAAQSLAFSFIKPMSPPSKEVHKQASYMRATWPMLLWGRAATTLPCDAEDEVRVLLTSEACPIGNDDAHKRIRCASSQSELSHDILHLFLACLEMQMPIAPASEGYKKLVSAGKELQNEVDDAVANSRFVKEVGQPSSATVDYAQQSM